MVVADGTTTAVGEGEGVGGAEVGDDRDAVGEGGREEGVGGVGDKRGNVDNAVGVGDTAGNAGVVKERPGLAVAAGSVLGVDGGIGPAAQAATSTIRATRAMEAFMVTAGVAFQVMAGALWR